MFEELAERADRAMRTFNARNTAEMVHTAIRAAVTANGTGDLESSALSALSERRGWHQSADHEFVCSFGKRKATLAIPTPFDPHQLTRLVTRVEINVFLGGGSDDTLLRELQALAQRELERLFAAETAN
jgi:hypothetical protein